MSSERSEHQIRKRKLHTYAEFLASFYLREVTMGSLQIETDMK